MHNPKCTNIKGLNKYYHFIINERDPFMFDKECKEELRYSCFFDSKNQSLPQFWLQYCNISDNYNINIINDSSLVQIECIFNEKDKIIIYLKDCLIDVLVLLLSEMLSVYALRDQSQDLRFDIYTPDLNIKCSDDFVVIKNKSNLYKLNFWDYEYQTFLFIMSQDYERKLPSMSKNEYIK